jgi:AcrR family transcriptional regulator
MTTVRTGAATGLDRRGPGRPRAEDLDARIIDAALRLIDLGEPVTVGRVVEVSGASRAALYRRWPTVTDLIAAALDRGRDVIAIPTDGDLEENILRTMTEGAGTVEASYSDERFRQRLRLGLADRALQRTYWTSHVARRRTAIADALRVGIERGILRPDLDVEACIDLINGVFYYQFVVRGDTWSDPGVLERCRVALRVAWRGMSVERAR